jgi:hypothetical protein
MILKKLLIAILVLCAPVFAYAAGTLTLTGTITSNHSEQNIIGGGQTLILNLTAGATWSATAAADATPWKAIFSSSGSWSDVSSAITTGDLVRTNDTTFTITLPASSTYTIIANEAVTITIPDALLATGSSLNTQSFTVTNLDPVITLSGTATPSLLESDIHTGGFTMVFDVQYDTWQATIGGNNAISSAFLAGITGNKDWASLSLGYANITRNSARRVTVSLPATATYVITANELVTCAIPAGSYLNGSVKAASDPTLTVTNVNPVITLSGTATPSLTEANIHTGGFTMIFDVKFDTWQTTLGGNNAISTAFLAGITGNKDWATVSGALTFSNITRNSATRVTLSLPAAAAYVITANETVTCAIPAGSYLNGSAKASIDPTLTVTNLDPVITLSGTATPSLSEANIHTGGFTMIFDLQYDTWQSTLGGSNAISTAFLAGITGNKDWATVSAALSYTNLTRNSATRVTLSLPVSAAYLITADETVTCTIPAGSYQNGSVKAASDPTLTVTNLNPVITLSGTATPSLTEANIHTGGFTMVFDVQYDSWQATIGGNNAISTAFLTSITGNKDWATIAPALSYTNLVRNSASRVTLTLPAVAAYVITANETVTCAIPGGSYLNGTAKASSDPTLTVTNLNPVVTISGTATPSLQEADIQAGGFTVVFDVQYDTWQGTMGGNNAVSTAFLAGITGNKDWATVSIALGYSNITRNSSTRLTLNLPVVADYAITGNETVSVNIPSGSFVGSSAVNYGTAFSVINQAATTSATWSTGSTTLTEAQVRAGGLTLTLHSSNNWNTNLATLKTQFIIGLDGGSGSDWNTKILPNINVARPSSKSAVITFAASASFNISTTQTITYLIPDAALATSSGAILLATPGSFSVSPAASSVSITPTSINEANLHGGYVDLSLSEDSFSVYSAVNPSNFTLTTAPAGTTISSVTNKTATGARLTFAYTGDIDVDGSIQITVNSGLAGGGTLTSNSATVVAVLEPIITAVTIPNQAYKINDIVPVTITVQNDGGQTFTLTSGTVADRTITAPVRQSSTSYTSSITLLSGTTDYAALSDIPVSVQMQVSGRPGNLYTTAISQSNDLLDANRPVVNSYQALGTIHKIGDFVQLVANADQAAYTVDSSQTSVNGVSINSSSFNFINEAGGSYYFSYQVSANDNDVANPAALTGQLVLKDAAGNTSVLKTIAAVSGTFSIDALAPSISSVTAPDSSYITGETIILTISTNGTGYSLSSETFINGISQSSGRFSLNGPGPVYTLNYPVLSGDAEVSAGNLPVNIVLKDPAGNKSVALTSFSNNVVVYTVKPTAVISGNTAICISDSATLFVNLTGKKNWNIVVTDGSVTIPFNGITSSPFAFKVAPSSNTSYSVLSVSDNTGLSNSGSGTASIIVHAKTPVTITSLGSTYSLESAAIILAATPSGGSFSGPGVVSAQNKFYPSIAGLVGSPHTILYTYTNNFGCVSYDSAHVSVVQAAGGILLNDLYCYNAAPITAQAFNDYSVTGQFELRYNGNLVPDGSGIHDNGDNTATITPTALSPGEYLLTYTYYFNDFFSLNKNFNIQFIDAPKILGLPDPAQICENVLPISLTGSATNGIFTGLGVTGNSGTGFKFDPRIPGSGIAAITYIDSTVNGCKNQSVSNITVNAITPVQINPLSIAYNVVHAPVNLSSTPSGGVFSGPGVENVSKKFYPDLAGLISSPHKILYTYTNSFGCISKDSVSVEVVKASGELILKNLYCYNASPFIASAVTDSTSIIGNFQLSSHGAIVPEGSGIVDNLNNTVTITPALLIPGDYVLNYKYFLKDTLSLSKTFTIEFIDAPKFTLADRAICPNSGDVPLVGDARKPNFTGTGVYGNSATGFRFDPSVTGNGLFTITYSDTTINGCKNQSAQDITVFYLPPMGFTRSDSCVLSSNEGSAITFTNTTIGKDSIRGWSWNFDDVNSGAKNFSNEVSPFHNFNKSGKYSVALTDTTVMGCIQKHEITYDFGDKPIGNFEVKNKCFTPGEVTKFLSQTSSNDGISSYSWTIFRAGDTVVNTTVATDSFDYQFNANGKYYILHKVTSNTDCAYTKLDSVILQPTIVILPGVPYTEDFDKTDGGWSPGKINDPAYPGLSWNWGTSGFAKLESAGKKAWFTHRENVSIKELSYLTSPCYNLSALERPMIKMDIFKNFPIIQDGTILETSTDNGATWNILGYPGDGINWYGDYQTTNYAFGTNYGWANPVVNVSDSGWIESRHILDQVGSSSNLQFRIVYGAIESSASGYEGFAIGNLSIEERERFSVFEHFTNTTGLNPIRDKAKSANTKLNTLYKKDLLYKDFVKLEYHTRFPSANDPLNVFNRDVPGARAFYYGIYSVPYSILDGGDRTGRRFDYSDTKFEPKEVDINLRSLEDPAVAIGVDAVLNGDELSVGVKIKALQSLPADDRVLYVVLYETRVSGFTAENGETQFQNVVRNILPDAGGTAIYQSFKASAADTTVLNYTFISDVSNLNKERIRVAVYLQNDFTGEIYQAGLSDYSRSLGTEANPDIVYENKVYVYPNPATDFVEISVSGTIEKNTRIEFFDQLGRQVYSDELQTYENTKVISTSGFNKGIYYLRMTSEGTQKSEVVKLVIFK